MTEEQLAEIKARRAAITEGEWWVYEGDMTSVSCTNPEYGDQVIANTFHSKDAAFIANAPAYIDALIAEVERLTLDLEEATEIRIAIDGEYSHAFEVYYDIQDRYAKKRAALKKSD